MRKPPPLQSLLFIAPAGRVLCVLQMSRNSPCLSHAYFLRLMRSPTEWDVSLEWKLLLVRSQILEWGSNDCFSSALFTVKGLLPNYGDTC